MRNPALHLMAACIMGAAAFGGAAASANEQSTPFCRISSMETDLHWTYFTLAKSCFAKERFQIRSDGNQNINLLAHVFAAHAGGLEISVRWGVHGFGPTVLGIKTRPPS